MISSQFSTTTALIAMPANLVAAPVAVTAVGMGEGTGTAPLTAFLDLLAPAADVTPASPEGQTLAAPGTPLPGGTPEDEDPAADPMFSWLTLGAPPMPTSRPMAFTAPAPTTPVSATSLALSRPAASAVSVTLPMLATDDGTASTIAPPPAELAREAVTQPTLPTIPFVSSEVAKPVQAPSSSFSTSLEATGLRRIRPVGDQPTATVTASPASQAISTPAGTPRDITARPSGVERLAPTAPGVPLAPVSPPMLAAPLPAASVFADAMAASLSQDARPDAADPTAPTPLATAPAILTAVVATAASDQPALDMARQDWPQAMIERIETLRDAADAVDTSIRLRPDALGAIDVSVRRDGDAVHIRFNAEQAQTRQLLAEAQPRLQELAEARGLRLGGSAIDAGGSNAGTGQQQRPPQPFNAPSPTAPARARATVDGADTDERIA